MGGGWRMRVARFGICQMCQEGGGYRKSGCGEAGCLSDLTPQPPSPRGKGAIWMRAVVCVAYAVGKVAAEWRAAGVTTS